MIIKHGVRFFIILNRIRKVLSKDVKVNPPKIILKLGAHSVLCLTVLGKILVKMFDLAC